MSSKFHFAKWGILCLAVVMALSSVGVTYAWWSGQGGRGNENLGTYSFDSGHGWWSNWWSRWWMGLWSFSWSKNECVETDSCDTEFIWVVSNDNGVPETQGGYDPIDPGDGSNDPSAPQAMGISCARYTKDVAKTNATLTEPTLINITINNAYPHYHPTIFYGIKNKGNLPGTIQTIEVDEDTTTPEVYPDEDAPELTVTVTGIYEGQEIAPSTEVVGDLDIHVEQCAAQNAGIAGGPDAYTISVKITVVCEEVEEECDTAYAYGGCYATCFRSINYWRYSWGWTNGPLPHGSYEFDIYAGAAQCSKSKGELVGTLTVNYYNSGNVIVTYNLDTPYTMDVTHLYVGNEHLPRDKHGRFTVSPGKYPYTQAHEDATECTYQLNGFSGEIYVIAHAVVCGPE